MSVNFRCLNINSLQTVNSKNLSVLLTQAKNGFYAFFAHSSLVTIKTASSSKLKNCFEQISTDRSNNGHTVITSIINPFGSGFSNWVPRPKCLLLVGEKISDDFSSKVLLLSQKLREVLADENNSFSKQAGFALIQASAINLISERFQQSPLMAGTLGYEEYLLWNDGGLWGQDDWNTRLAEFNHLGNKASLRLAWLGSGWLCSRLDESLSGNNNAWFYEPDIETWAKTAMETLLQFDEVLIKHYEIDKSSVPPGRKPWNSYVRTLCDFLPYHYSRDEPKELLPSNGLANKGGPRVWRGFLHDSTTMHIRHLLLDGWLTLWPVSDEKQQQKLYIQPGSIALLYWAARQADMPHTESTEAFLKGYDWSDPNWFGGQWNYQADGQS